MFILIEESSGRVTIVKWEAIRRIYARNEAESVIQFEGNINSPLTIIGTPREFYEQHLAKRA